MPSLAKTTMQALRPSTKGMGAKGQAIKSLAKSKPKPPPISDEMLMKASEHLSPGEFEVWKNASRGGSTSDAASLLGGAEGGSDGSARVLLAKANKKARQHGFPEMKIGRGKVTSDKTRRVLELKAKGVKSRIIAETLFPERPSKKAINYVEVVASKNQEAIEKLRKGEKLWGVGGLIAGGGLALNEVDWED